jgi:glycosyltransferase involved in cell wall biosynthesis
LIRAGLPLVLAGGQGWGFTDPANIARRLGIERFVRLAGYVNDAELHALYRGARFLAMPSLYEGFGLPIIEANAAGIPVLTSNTSSMPEVAGDAALLVDPLDVSSIAAGLERLACDDNEHARLAARARANASRFDWAKSAAAMESVFEEAILARRSCGNAE